MSASLSSLSESSLSESEMKNLMEQDNDYAWLFRSSFVFVFFFFYKTNADRTLNSNVMTCSSCKFY